ncbi:hypothetical protein OKW21_003195 [Catalinimonas alkaloidigena]|nr:hypothetical protein [Catalinimonas alkaloidigena]
MLNTEDGTQAEVIVLLYALVFAFTQQNDRKFYCRTPFRKPQLRS